MAATGATVAGVAVNWLFFSGLIALVGSAATHYLVVPRDTDEACRFARGVCRSTGMLAAGLLKASLLLLFWVKLTEFRDPFAAWEEDARALLETRWGLSWAAAVVAAALCGGAFLLATRAGVGRGRQRWFAVGSALAAVLAAFPSATGHAQVAAEEWRWLAVGSDVLHVLAAGGWIGGLAAVVVCELRWTASGRASKEKRSLLPLLVPRFSPLALRGAGVLVLTGVFASALHVGGPSALIDTAYGRVLLAKAVAVVAVMALGARNWRRLTPRLLAAEDGRRPLARSAALELAIAHVVILITAVLVRTNPGSPWGWENLGW